MKFSKSWLQEYIAEILPSNNEVEEILNKKAFEVEETIALPNDTVFDIKVLPNRAHDALGHRGMARELCADFGFTFKEDIRVEKSFPLFTTIVPAPAVAIDDEIACTRFMSLRIDKIKVEPSPLWLKEKLEAIGQRSINNIVDVTNYVQFALNKPMHAYDARSIAGTLRARFARTGETLTTLDEKELTLDERTLVITDDEKTLGLAGIKGGKFSGIQADTTSVILESANFKPTLIRKTAERYGIKTDASKRFENGIANSLVEEGLYMTAHIIMDLFPSAVVSAVTDVYPKKDTPYYVGISLKEVNGILGASYSESDVKSTLTKLGFSFEKIIPKDYITKTYPTLVGAIYKNPSSMREDAPKAFSCSSLVSYLYKGIWMPSLSIDKYVFSKKITKDQLTFGDCIFACTGEGKIRYESVEFLRGTKVPEGIDHVGMYVGDGKVIHATKVKGVVVIESIDEFALGRTIVGYGRMADDLEEERYVVTVPQERLDIRIKEDLAEEIGRIIGYDTLKPHVPQLSRVGILSKRAFYENKIREVLLAHDFSEVMTYTFGDKGEVELVKGLADDKEKLRTNIRDGFIKALATNLYNAPLLGQKTIKLFELGNVFTKRAERKHLSVAFAVSDKKTYKSELDNFLKLDKEVVEKISYNNIVRPEANKIYKEMFGEDLGLPYVSITGDETSKVFCLELDFDTLIESLPEPLTYEAPTFASLPAITYKTVSPYPFITRDIAMWVPGGTSWESIRALCDEVHNPLVTRIDLFDTFSKATDGIEKTSFAFRLVFQSYEKTLTDEEVNEMMEPYYERMKNKGYEIR